MRKRKTKLIGKWHLLIAVVITLFGLYNILFNPQVRTSIGLSETTVSPKALWNKVSGGGGAVDVDKIVSVDPEALRKFAEALDNRAVVSVRLPEIEAPATTNGGPSAATPAMAPEVKLSLREREVIAGYLPWRPQIGGWATNGRRAIYINGQACYEGDEIVSKDNPGRCRYRILSVLDKSVWLQAVPQKPSEEFKYNVIGDGVDWPQIVRIVEEKRKGEENLSPSCVLLANGERIPIGGVFSIGDSRDMRYSVRWLWSRAVCFDVEKRSTEEVSGGAKVKWRHVCRIVCCLRGGS